VAGVLTRRQPLGVILGRVAELMTDGLRADGCLVYRVEPDGQLALAAIHPALPTDAEHHHVDEMRLPSGFGVVGRVAADGVAAVLVDDNPRNALHREILGLGEGAVVSRLCVPARFTDGPSVAVVALHSLARRRFGADEVELAQRAADLVGLRLALERSAAALADYERGWDGLVAATVTAQETERRRVAGDLHDGVTQAVASLTFHLSAAEIALADGDSSFAAEQVRAARGMADLAFDEARRAIAGLHSPVLDDLGLAAGLVSMARGVPAMQVDVDAQEVDLPDHVANALFRIAQEAVHNVVKHAQARTAIVRLETRGRTVVLSVADDGVGFDSSGQLGGRRSRSAVPRYGLAGMFERVQLLGGQLTVTSSPGHGTTVEVVMPA
jgi:two-component system NarL family sensor kinase